ncbi:hypothetical protein PR048_003439, partial [Dryococelus australis]
MPSTEKECKTAAYKGTYLKSLFAIVNANYELSRFKWKYLPQSFSLPSTNVSVPCVFLGDSAFALDTHIMKQFPGSNFSREKRIFNYKLRRTQRIAENALSLIAL